MITEEFKDIIRACEQCGTCTASCPTNEASDFNIRKLVKHLQLELHEDKDFLSKYPWLCTQCYRCRSLCTEGLEIPKLVMALRGLALEKKFAPENVSKINSTIKESGSPYFSRSRTKRFWVSDADMEGNQDADLLYWVGCTPSLMAQNIAQATATVLKKLDLKYKLLNKEPCCGEPLITLGLVEDAREVAQNVVKEVEAADVKRIVTSCSGCYSTFTQLYPEILGVTFPNIEILHISQILSKNIEKGFKLEKPLKVTYHDPCSLGRHSKVFDAPREVLGSIEGIDFIEMDRTKEFASCCGGGGGVLSLDYKIAMDIADKMLKRDVMPLEVEGLVTCCPMCYQNFKRTAAKNRIPIKVYDLVEIVAQSTRR
jgi:Fe-S oxidoreductase